MAMWITASILTMDTTGLCPHAAQRGSITSRQMRPVTDAVMRSQGQAMTEVENTHCPDSVVVVVEDAARFDLRL
jgi:hypothetical protein